MTKRDTRTPYGGVIVFAILILAAAAVLGYYGIVRDDWNEVGLAVLGALGATVWMVFRG